MRRYGYIRGKTRASMVDDTDGGQRHADVGAGGRHRRRSPLLQPGLHAAGPGRGPRADLGLSGEHQLPSSCLLQNLCHQLSLIVVAT